MRQCTSIHRNGVLVRAGSERRARELALLAFAIAVDTRAGRGSAPPWRDADRVHARVVDDFPYPADGPEGILEPTLHG
jgi:hypothetical protein